MDTPAGQQRAEPRPGRWIFNARIAILWHLYWCEALSKNDLRTLLRVHPPGVEPPKGREAEAFSRAFGKARQRGEVQRVGDLWELTLFGWLQCERRLPDPRA